MEDDIDEDVIFDQAGLLTNRVKPVADERLTSHKVYITVCLCFAFCGLGLCIAIPGPTLLDLQDQTSTTTEEISWLFTGRSLGYLIGSIVGGFLFDQVNQLCLLSLSLLLTAVATALAPLCTKLSLLMCAVAFQGVSMGFLDTGGNVLCLYTWGRGSGPYMQTLHFSFGVGAFVAPLVAEPFLSKRINETSEINSTGIITTTMSPGVSEVPTEHTVANITCSLLSQHNCTEPEHDTIIEKLTYSVTEVIKTINSLSRVQFAYLTIALLILCVSIMFFVACCQGSISLKAIKNAEVEARYVIRKDSKGFRIQILILLFVFYFLYVGMEVTYGGLIMTFTHSHLGWTKQVGTMLTSVFWGSFAAGRLLAIPLAKCLSPPMMLIADLMITSLSLTGLVMGLETNHVIIWFCTATLGVGLASIFPTGITWAERYMQVTGKSTAVFVVGSALGEMAMPALTGFLFQNKGPMWLLYIMLGSAIVSIVIYIIMQNLATNMGERYEKLAAFSSTSQLLGDSEDLEMDGVVVNSDADATAKKKKVPTATLR